LQRLPALKNLVRLDLAASGPNGKVTDIGLKELARHENLATLNLFLMQGVTDAGLEEIAHLKNLTTLHLGATRVTEAGVSSLRKRLPHCAIVR
jgi:hypothetical protein